ncbi:MAG: septum formation initiator family protein [Desulfuromonadales bacterium]|nr:septum formation initiator family protein [Desulfuromonadales bacterium]
MSRAEPTPPKNEPKQPGPNLWLVIATVAGCALLLTILFGGHGLMRWLQYDQDKKALRAELEKIEEQNAQTRREIDSLMHNRKYIESLARRDLGMVKADEIIYQFPNSEKPSSATQVRPDGQ